MGVTDEEILGRWDEIEAGEPDISTEQLFARVLDAFEFQIDSADIAEALGRRAIAE